MDEREPEPCARFEEALPALLGIDGDRLPPAEEEALLAHSAGCPRCSELRRSYAATVDLLRLLPRKDAPPDFLSWVRREGYAAPGGRRPRLPQGLLLAAAAVLVLGVTVTTFLVSRWGTEVEVAVREDATPAKDAVPPSPSDAAGAEMPAPAPSVDLPRERSPTGAIAAASPVGDGEAIGIVLNVEAPVPPERWAEEVTRLEEDLRARFEAPRGEVQRRGRDAVALQSAEGSGDAERRDAREEADAPPGERDLRLDIEGSSLPLLVERLEGWAKDAGGSVRVEDGATALGKLRVAPAAVPAAAGAGLTAARVRVQLKLRPAAGAKNP